MSTTATRHAILRDAIDRFIRAKSAVRVSWTAANLIGNGLEVFPPEAEVFRGGPGEFAEGSYFPTEREVLAAMRTHPEYVGPDRTESGRGAFGRMGGSGLRSRYHEAYIRRPRTANPTSAGDVRIWTEDGKIKVMAPFSLDFQRRALELGGRWNRSDGFWFFDQEQGRAVRAAAHVVYGAGDPGVQEDWHPVPGPVVPRTAEHRERRAEAVRIAQRMAREEVLQPRGYTRPFTREWAASLGIGEEDFKAAALAYERAIEEAGQPGAVAGRTSNPAPAGPSVRAEDYEIREVRPDEQIKRFITEHHYSRSHSNAYTLVHAMYDRRTGELVGVAWWMPSMPEAHKSAVRWVAERTGLEGDRRHVLHLSRLVVKPGMPQNAAGLLLGRSMRLIDRRQYPILLTYADTGTVDARTGEAHRGTIYRATNWIDTGDAPGGRVWVHRITGEQRGQKRGKINIPSEEMRALGYVQKAALPKRRFIQVDERALRWAIANPRRTENPTIDPDGDEEPAFAPCGCRKDW